MAKLTKHAEVLNQLHTMVKKQAEEAQKSVTGAPGGVKSVSVGDEHESHNKNSIGPENVPQGYHQKPSDDPSEPLSKSKSASDLGTEILDIIRKQAEAQDTVSGKPGDVKSESVGDDQEKVDKNAVKPENNKQDYKQNPSTDSSKPLANAKKASVEDLATKVASYELGRQFCAALLKNAGDRFGVDEELMEKEAGRRDFDVILEKQAGRRDFDVMIAQAAESLHQEEQQIKQASFQGAAYFDELLKQAALEEVAAENEALTAKLAEYENFIKQAQAEYAQQTAYASQQEQQEKLAESVAAVVLGKLKSEMV